MSNVVDDHTMKKSNLPKIRTIDAAAEWLRENDPDTALTKTALRRLVVTGQLPSIRIGQKYLIDLDILSDYLRGSTTTAVDEMPGIRRTAL